eukprot:scaffold9346_cov67-Attheya_sp.AAC.4
MPESSQVPLVTVLSVTREKQHAAEQHAVIRTRQWELGIYLDDHVDSDRAIIAGEFTKEDLDVCGDGRRALAPAAGSLLVQKTSTWGT